ncbi:MAG: diacylglycerol kinase family lipid kinase [Brucellaceae bacterium]|nr:diacylglycerol kinase family lipid kinase [Brucellaceae bacterium]
MTIAAVLNREGGTLRTTDLAAYGAHLQAAFSARGHALDIDIVAGRQVTEALRRAAGSDADAILCGGGDGTVSAGAAVAWKTGKALGVLPAGTMNMFARSLGIPLDIHEAAEALAGGTIAPADIATANGRPFIHQYSVGVQPRMVTERSRIGYRSRLEKLISSMRAAFGAIGNPPSFRAHIDLDAATGDGPYSFVAVSNNLYGEGHMPYADDVAGGELGVYWVGVLSPGENLELAADLVRGNWKDNPNFGAARTRSVELAFPARRRRHRATIDGELIALEDRVELRIHPGELKVIAPAPGV